MDTAAGAGLGPGILTEMSLWRLFWTDESGQDLVEYALLTALIGLVGMTVWSGIVTLVGERYTEYDSGVQGLWESPDPP